MPPLGLTDAERLKQLIVDPVIGALRTEMRELTRPLVDEITNLRQADTLQNARLETIESRLTTLERFKVKIAAVCSTIALITGIAWRMLLDWAKEKLSKGHP
ncbi:MAG: hypothetical protein M3O30_16395 [Planctomycetota bacterium]|nr:hypothetical protein [Planctomycetota bacterium]